MRHDSLKLYHGTSRASLLSIQQSGVDAPSYWGTLQQAQEYASSFGDEGVILVSHLAMEDLKASVYVAQGLYDAGDLDKIPVENDLVFSLENLGGVTCHAVVHHFSVFEPDLP